MINVYIYLLTQYYILFTLYINIYYMLNIIYFKILVKVSTYIIILKCLLFLVHTQIYI